MLRGKAAMAHGARGGREEKRQEAGELARGGPRRVQRGRREERRGREGKAGLGVRTEAGRGVCGRARARDEQREAVQRTEEEEDAQRTVAG